MTDLNNSVDPYVDDDEDNRVTHLEKTGANINTTTITKDQMRFNIIAATCFALFFAVLGSGTSFYIFRYRKLVVQQDQCFDPLFNPLQINQTLENDEEGKPIRRPFWENPEFSKAYYEKFRIQIDKNFDMIFVHHTIPVGPFAVVSGESDSSNINLPFTKLPQLLDSAPGIPAEAYSKDTCVNFTKGSKDYNVEIKMNDKFVWDRVSILMPSVDGTDAGDIEIMVDGSICGTQKEDSVGKTEYALWKKFICNTDNKPQGNTLTISKTGNTAPLTLCGYYALGLSIKALEEMEAAKD